MRPPTLATLATPATPATQQPDARLYERSYYGMRLAIGAFGGLLPVTLVLLDRLVINGSQVRASMSAYYHSPARDLFVGGLCVIAALLLTYLSAQPGTWDFVLSFVGGIAVLVVAFFPTWRPGADHARPCAMVDGVSGPCTPLQSKVHENVSATLHGIGSGVFVLMIAALCVVFALHERRAPRPRPVRIRLFAAAAVAVVVGGAWAAVGPDLHLQHVWGHTYVGEVIAFGSFTLAWLTSSWDLLAALGPRLGLGRGR